MSQAESAAHVGVVVQTLELFTPDGSNLTQDMTDYGPG